MTYPVGARIRYRDQIDGPVGVIESYYKIEHVDLGYYYVKWSDYDRVFHHTAHFIETELEVF